MGVQVANNAASKLAGSINTVVTSLSVTSGDGAKFPAASTASGDYFYATLIDVAGNIEIVKVTDRTTDTFTVVRARDGTTAKAFASNDRIELRPVAGLFNDLPNRLLQTADYADASITTAKLAAIGGLIPNTYGGLGKLITLTVNSKGLLTAVSDAALVIPYPIWHRTILTASSGTFTTNAKHLQLVITVVGGGGGGGNGTNLGSTVLGATAAGAQGGGALKKLLTLAPSTGYAYTVGAGGGYTDANGSNPGTASTFTAGTVYSAPGGSGVGNTSLAAAPTTGDENYRGSLGNTVYASIASATLPGGLNGLGHGGLSVGAGLANSGQGGAYKAGLGSGYNGGSGFIIVDELY